MHAFNKVYFCLLAISIFISFPVAAMEEIIGFPVYKKDYIRNPYNLALIQQILDATADEYGPYEFSFPNFPMINERSIKELEMGVNLHIIPSTYKLTWAGRSIVVPFPINKGINSFRVFFSHKMHKPALAKVKTLKQLHNFSFGLGRGWSTVNIMEHHQFNVVYIDSYDGLYEMIERNRFQLLMQGALEIFVEKGKTMLLNEGAYLVNDFYCYIYLPSYFHVTPTRPMLAERIEKGLKILDADGKIEALIHKHSTKALDLIRSIESPVFFLENINLPPDYYERDKPYLLDIVIK